LGPRQRLRDDAPRGRAEGQQKTVAGTICRPPPAARPRP
jgi:hypothetical protein